MVWMFVLDAGLVWMVVARIGIRFVSMPGGRLTSMT